MDQRISFSHLHPILPEHIEIQVFMEAHYDMLQTLDKLHRVVSSQVTDEGEKKLLLADLEDLYQFLTGSLESRVSDAGSRKN